MILLESEMYELDYLVKNKKLTYNHNVTKKLTKIWEQTTLEERMFLIEFLSVVYPEKVKLINESRWYNTLADIIGIFDPTGVVDILNGISYWRQGDKMFAILSWIAAVPYLGDMIAKPIIGVMKVGAPATRAFKGAIEAGNAKKIADTAVQTGKEAVNFVKSVNTWGDNVVSVLRKTVGRVPFGLPLLAGGATLSGKGFVKLVQEWVDLFKTAKAEMQVMGKTSAFRSYKGIDQSFVEKFLTGGIGSIMGNPATRSLVMRTKAYLGFLDSLGLGDFVNDPTVLENPNMQDKFKKYIETDEGKKKWEEDLSGAEMPDLTPEQWKEYNKKYKSNKFDMGSVATLVGSKDNPIISLFATILK